MGDINNLGQIVGTSINGDGNIYGVVSGIENARYFIARPDYIAGDPGCSLGNSLYLAKPDGSYYYVPQKLPSGNVRYSDLNGDGVVDYVRFSGAFAAISYQSTQGASDTAPEPTADPEPVTNPEPIIDTNPNPDGTLIGIKVEVP